MHNYILKAHQVIAENFFVCDYNRTLFLFSVVCVDSLIVTGTNAVGAKVQTVLDVGASDPYSCSKLCKDILRSKYFQIFHFFFFLSFFPIHLKKVFTGEGDFSSYI